MDINKAIAQRELQIFGGIPKVTRYWNDSQDKNIDILKCLDVPQKGIQSCASIGLNAIDIGLQSGEKSLRVEIFGVSDVLVNDFENIIASASFAIMEFRKCYPGYIVKGIIDQYIQDSDMKHILLTDPFMWKNADSISIDNICVAWLMAVPISEQEYEYAQAKGIDALEQLFEEKDIDIYNIYRKSEI